MPIAAHFAVVAVEHPEVGAAILVRLGPVMHHLRCGRLNETVHVCRCRAVADRAHHEQPSRVALLHQWLRPEQREILERQPHVW
jgi:hypothetical protein